MAGIGVICRFSLLLVLFLAPAPLAAQNPVFEYSIEAPPRVGGPPGSTVRFSARVRMRMEGLVAREEGPRGWSVAVRVEDTAPAAAGCRIVGATTDGTVAAPESSGGLRPRDGFEQTELAAGQGNEGAVSGIILSTRGAVFLPGAQSPADILVLTIEARVPRDGCFPCTVSFAESLAGSGEPVPNVVTYLNRSFTPALGSARIEVCGACFEDEPQIGPWRSLEVGDIYTGAARASRDGCVEICSIGRGQGSTRDEFQALSTFARADMDLLVELRDLAPAGEAGISMRTNTRFAGSQYMGIAVERTAAGTLTLVSSIRRLKDGAAEVTRPVPIRALPLFLSVRRTGDRITTLFGSDPQNLEEHASEEIGRTELARDSQELILYSASGDQGEARALFCDPRVIVTPTTRPPIITAVSPTIGPLEGGIEVKIAGSGLCPEPGATQVLIAGVPAEVKECDDQSLVVVPGPIADVAHGDVLVRTPLGEESLPRAFLYAGRNVARGDCNCDGLYDISDPVSKLGFLFRGTDPCCCFHALDTNGDRRGDITDPLGDLIYLFQDGPPPPPPFPQPGPSPDVPCDLPPAPEVTGISQVSIREGDVVTIRGLGFSPNPEENLVLFGNDARGEVLDASARSLAVRVPELVVAERVPITVIRIPPGILDLLCKTTQCSPVLSGLGLASPVHVELNPSELQVLATSEPSAEGVTLLFDRRAYNPLQPVAVRGGFGMPPVQDVSFGSLHFGFEHVDPSARSFTEFLTGFGEALERQLRAGGAASAVSVRVNANAGTIDLRLDQRVREFIDVDAIPGFVSVFWQNCRCDGLDPDLDERAYGWCRFTDLITSCSGIPRFQYFIPDGLAMQQSDAIFPLDDPLSYSPGEKRVLYNKDAYCHVRKHNLWNLCKLTKLRDNGETEVPEFPCKAIVMKTQWRTAANLPAMPDPDDLYYHYDHNGTRFYLTLLHYTDKSRKDWHWADLYVAEADGGVGGCGGSKVGMPAGAPWVAPWSNYSMCTNITDPPGPDCGNLEIPIECVQTCQGCHDGATFGGTLRKDFLFSLGGPANVPGSPDCD